MIHYNFLNVFSSAFSEDDAPTLKPKLNAANKDQFDVTVEIEDDIITEVEIHVFIFIILVLV